MKRSRLNILFISCLVALLLHQIQQKIVGCSISWLDNYLDPLLFMPIFLYLLRIERRTLFKRNTIPINHILGYWILISIIAEGIFPLLSSNFTADYWDILCYGVGGAIFAYYQSAENRSTSL